MGFIYVNPNPENNITGDCTIRALSLVLNKDWDSTYVELAVYGFMLKDMPSSNRTWSFMLYEHGFIRSVIPNTCPDCYTIRQFCLDHPQGVYLLATGTHVVAVINGNYYDSWDSGNEVPIYYWKKR